LAALLALWAKAAAKAGAKAEPKKPILKVGGGSLPKLLIESSSDSGYEA
jgi:hypothetical protein